MRLGDGCQDLLPTCAERLESLLCRQPEHVEAGLPDDDGVPIARGGSAPERARRVLVARVGGGHVEDPCRRVELREVAGPLLGEVVGDDDQGLVRLADTARLHDRGYAGVGLARADDMRDEGPLVALEDACDGVLLVVAKADGGVASRQA